MAHQQHVFLLVIAQQLQSLRFSNAAHGKHFAVARGQARVLLRFRFLMRPPIQAWNFQQIVAFAAGGSAVEIGEPTAILEQRNSEEKKSIRKWAAS